MAITAQQVNELRKKTGAGMMDCKKALTESNGDLEGAVDILRKTGQKIAAKREDRDAAEGVVLAKTNADNTLGVLISLNCETDFVAKNDDYIGMAETILEKALTETPSTKEDLLNLPFNDSLSIADKLTEQMGVIGEKIEISSYESLKDETVSFYIHPGNRLASLVALNKNGGEMFEAGRQVAMQVAAMNPVALNKDSVAQSTIDRELEVGKELAIQEGKPAEMADKIAQGRLGKFFKENTLLSQISIKDSKKTVQQFLSEKENDLTCNGFKRVSLGN